MSERLRRGGTDPAEGRFKASGCQFAAWWMQLSFSVPVRRGSGPLRHEGPSQLWEAHSKATGKQLLISNSVNNSPQRAHGNVVKAESTGPVLRIVQMSGLLVRFDPTARRPLIAGQCATARPAYVGTRACENSNSLWPHRRRHSLL